LKDSDWLLLIQLFCTPLLVFVCLALAAMGLITGIILDWDPGINLDVHVWKGK